MIVSPVVSFITAVERFHTANVIRMSFSFLLLYYIFAKARVDLNGLSYYT